MVRGVVRELDEGMRERVGECWPATLRGRPRRACCCWRAAAVGGSNQPARFAISVARGQGRHHTSRDGRARARDPPGCRHQRAQRRPPYEGAVLPPRRPADGLCRRRHLAHLRLAAGTQACGPPGMFVVQASGKPASLLFKQMRPAAEGRSAGDFPAASLGANAPTAPRNNNTGVGGVRKFGTAFARPVGECWRPRRHAAGHAAPCLLPPVASWRGGFSPSARFALWLATGQGSLQRVSNERTAAAVPGPKVAERRGRAGAVCVH